MQEKFSASSTPSGSLVTGDRRIGAQWPGAIHASIDRVIERDAGMVSGEITHDQRDGDRLIVDDDSACQTSGNGDRQAVIDAQRLGAEWDTLSPLQPGEEFKGTRDSAQIWRACVCQLKAPVYATSTAGLESSSRWSDTRQRWCRACWR
jgi:hypothetical protein